MKNFLQSKFVLFFALSIIIIGGFYFNTAKVYSSSPPTVSFSPDGEDITYTGSGTNMGVTIATTDNSGSKLNGATYTIERYANCPDPVLGVGRSWCSHTQTNGTWSLFGYTNISLDVSNKTTFSQLVQIPNLFGRYRIKVHVLDNAQNITDVTSTDFAFFGTCNFGMSPSTQSWQIPSDGIYWLKGGVKQMVGFLNLNGLSEGSGGFNFFLQSASPGGLWLDTNPARLFKYGDNTCWTNNCSYTPPSSGLATFAMQGEGEFGAENCSVSKTLSIDGTAPSVTFNPSVETVIENPLQGLNVEITVQDTQSGLTKIQNWNDVGAHWHLEKNVNGSWVIAGPSPIGIAPQPPVPPSPRSLIANATVPLKCSPNPCYPGDYRIVVQAVDDVGNVNETINSPTYHILGLPDLAMASNPTPLTHVAGNILFSSTIINQGTISTGAGFTNLFQFSTSPTGSNPTNYTATTTSPLLKNGQVVTQKSISLTEGIYYMRVCADNDASFSGTIAEAVEDNNCSAWIAVTISPAPLPDLVTVDIPLNALHGGVMAGTNPLYLTVQNIGEAPTSTGFTNIVQISSSSTGSNPTNYTVPINQAVGVGAPVTNFSPQYITINAGIYYIRACADNNTAFVGTITESNENNNCSAWTELDVTAPTVLPTVTSPSVTNMMGSTTATLGAVIGSLGIPASLTAHGTCWSTTTPVPKVGQSGNNCLSIGSGGTTGYFTQDRTGLSSTDLIYFLGYATNSTGTGYSTEGTFCPYPLTLNGSACAMPTTSGSLTATNCQITAGNSTCDTSLSWTTTNPVATSAVTTPTSITVGTGNSGSASYTLNYNSTRTFYLYNNNVLLDQKTPSATCASGTSWDATSGTCKTIPPVMSGSLTATDCVIALGGNSCNTTLNWNTVNPVATSAVTSNYPNANTIVYTGNTGSNKIALVPYSTRIFYLYNNSVLLDQKAPTATCASGTSWDATSRTCKTSTVLSGTLTANPSPCLIGAGQNSCITTLSWAINNTEAIPSQITANGMTPIDLATPVVGGTYSGTKFYTFTSVNKAAPVGKTFYLYNNSKSLVPNSPFGSGLPVNVGCVSGTSWSNTSGTCENIPATKVTLSTGTDGSGSGTVTGAGTYNLGETASVVATPNLDSVFVGWSGDCSGTNPAVSVLMNANKTCTATFRNASDCGTIDFVASPTSIYAGGSTQLKWSSCATTCTGTNFDTGNAHFGIVTVNPLVTTTYTVTCDRVARSASVIITVKKKPIIIEN